MGFGRGLSAVVNVTLRALERRIGFFLLKLKVEYSFRGRFDVAARPRPPARPDGDFLCLLIERVHRPEVVTIRATQPRVRQPLVPEFCGVTPAPLL